MNTYFGRVIGVAAVFITFVIRVNAADEGIPLIQMDGVPLVDAIGNLARQANLNIILDPHVPGSGFSPGKSAPKPNVSGNWRNVTAVSTLNAILKENKLTMVTNPATTVARIAPVGLDVKPVSASQVGTNTGPVFPVVTLGGVSLTDAISQLAGGAKLKVSF